MDTGSDVVWFPCTSRYLCKHCSFSSSSSSPRIQPFIPKESSSSKIIGCKNPKCSWIHQSNINCDQDCSVNSCLNQTCPPYMILFDDDTKKSSSLVLDIEQLDSGKKTNALVYTPFVKKPKVEDKSSFSVYYYLGLRRITIGADTM
ncbi:ASPARTYL PROTEASES [Salix koriyanagi]|uniref:ASPARTYL PROTEASES n=1 Tax=Salix koriyanagi TaxID=2511006 RepID=A0A9Q0SS28_9ROSI|nr:ASPARTYL PROTEASES [Salix koriyanagi]